MTRLALTLSVAVAMLIGLGQLQAREKDPMPGKLKAKLPNKLKMLERNKFSAADRTPADYGLTGENKLSNAFSSRLNVSIPDSTPYFVNQPTVMDGKEYRPYIVDQAEDDGWWVFYRFNPGSGHDYTGAQFLVVRYTDTFEVKFKLLLNKHLLYKRTEVQDVRFKNGFIYFNEACGTYSKSYKGKCSHITCLDPITDTVKWRTPNLVSNNLFIFKDDDTIISGYGFTDEKDYLFVVDANNGKVKSRTSLGSGHYYLEIKDGKVHVFTYNAYSVFQFKK